MIKCNGSNTKASSAHSGCNLAARCQVQVPQVRARLLGANLGRLGEEAGGTSKSTETVKRRSALAQPILSWKTLDSGKLLFVIGDDRITKGNRLRRNKHVIGADWRASLFKPRT
jgi:hypothetical protein